MQAGRIGALVAMALSAAGCGATGDHAVASESLDAVPTGSVFVVRDTTMEATQDVSAVAEPIAQATLGTKLMGTVTAVLVKEGDRVKAGQVLARIDARDLEAKRAQVLAGIAGADAVHREAELMATRMRALYVDSAAPKAQLDAAEAGLARAEAGVAVARAGRDELEAITGYAAVRAPFAGMVTMRFVDPGAFAVPGGALLTVQDNSKLRIAATVSPAVAREVKRGAKVAVSVEGVTALAIVEGVVPTALGSLYTINAIADNRSGALSAGGSARLSVERGTRRALLIPTSAVRREGDLAGVAVASGGGATTRWLKLGATAGRYVEVLAGLAAGDTVLVPLASGRE